MGLPEIFSTSQADSFEQTMMMTTFELTSWLVAFIAVMTILITVVGIIYMIRSESRKSPTVIEEMQPGHSLRRQTPARRPHMPVLHSSHRTSIIR